jgi:hypothetical protein
MLRALEKQLKKEKVKRIDTAVVTDNAGAVLSADGIQGVGGGAAGEGVVRGSWLGIKGMLP